MHTTQTLRAQAGGRPWGQGQRGDKAHGPGGGPAASAAPGGRPPRASLLGAPCPNASRGLFTADGHDRRRRPSLRPRGRGSSFAVAQGSGGRLRPSREAILVAAIVSRSRLQRLLRPSVATQSEPPAPAPHAGMEGSAAPTPVPSNPDG